MQHYLITIETRDGEYEYWDRWLYECDENATDIDILKDFTGLDGENDWSQVYSSWHENSEDYRHYRVRDRQHVTPEDLVVLNKYGL